jgi:hypothetical protein
MGKHRASNVRANRATLYRLQIRNGQTCNVTWRIKASWLAAQYLRMVAPRTSQINYGMNSNAQRNAA